MWCEQEGRSPGEGGYVEGVAICEEEALLMFLFRIMTHL